MSYLDLIAGISGIVQPKKQVYWPEELEKPYCNVIHSLEKITEPHPILGPVSPYLQHEVISFCIEFQTFH